jgi:hypothetical protein
MDLIKTAPAVQDTRPIRVYGSIKKENSYFERHGLSCAQLLDMVEAAVRECFNPGLSDQEMRDIARHVAFHWNPNEGNLKKNFVRVVQWAAQDAFAKKPTETLRRHHARQVSETLISMAECEPAERPVQSDQFHPHDWTA